MEAAVASTSTSTPPKTVNSATLTALLDCPVCFEICTPPIHSCKIGHKVCKECLPRLERCPSCRSKYVGTRNFVAEELYLKLQQAGVIESDDLESPIPCYLGTLNGTFLNECDLDLSDEGKFGTFASYMEHLKQKHNVHSDDVQLGSAFNKRFYFRNNSFVKNGTGPSRLLILNCSDQSFLVSLHMQQEDNVYILVATSSKKTAREFQVEMKIRRVGNEENVASWKGKVNDGNETPEQILSSKSCLIVQRTDLTHSRLRRAGTICSFVLELIITKSRLAGTQIVPGTHRAAIAMIRRLNRLSRRHRHDTRVQLGQGRISGSPPPPGRTNELYMELHNALESRQVTLRALRREQVDLLARITQFSRDRANADAS